MANLLWNQRQQQAQKQLDDQAKAEAYQMLAVSKMDPQTMLGYKLGQYLGNMFGRSEDASLRAKANQPSGSQYDAMAAKNGDAINSNLMDNLTPEAGANASTLLAGINAQKAAPTSAAETASTMAAAPQAVVAEASAAPSAWDQMAAKNGDVSGGGLLNGLPTDSTTATVGGSGGDTMGSLGTIGSAGKLANGNGNLLDLANVVKYFFPFDSAATPTAKADAAPQEQQFPQVVQESQQPQEEQSSQQETVQSVAQQSQAQHQPDSSGPLVKAIANGELLPTPGLVANHNQNVLQAVKQAVSPDMSTEEYYNMLYNKFRGMGYGYDACQRIASEKAQVYQAQRITDLASQFTSKGLGSSGAINNYGAQVLVKIAQESPQSYEILSRMYATPKDDYGFNKSIQQAVLNSDLQWKRDDHLFTNEEKKAKANLERTKDLHGFDANLNVRQKEALAQIELKTKGMELRQRYGIMFDTAKQLGMDDKSASQYALGIIGKDNSRYMDPQVKVQLEAAKAVIYDHNKHISNGGTDKDYPNMDAYNQAMAVYTNYLNGGSGVGGGERNLNNYSEAVADATAYLTRASQKGTYTKQQIIDGFKSRYGDMADNIIAGIDWSQWGYPNDKPKQAVVEEPNYTGEEYLLGSK